LPYILDFGHKVTEKFAFFQIICKKICIFQKKVLPLHPQSSIKRIKIPKYEIQRIEYNPFCAAPIGEPRDCVEEQQTAHSGQYSV
jgi:hypothetical protein